MKRELIAIIVFASVAVHALQIGDLDDTTPISTTESEYSGNVSLVSLAKAQSIADSLSDAAALKMYHYGDPNQELTPDEAFGFDPATGTIANYVVSVGGVNVVIPYEIGGVSVVGIGRDAFKFDSSITNVILPKSVTILDYNSFYGCTNLVSISAPGVLKIGTGTFDWCSSLRNISLSGCETLYTYAFFGCTSLCEIYAPNLKHIQSKAFMKCYSLTEIDLRNVVGIGSYAFSGCTNLLSVTWGSLNPVEQSTSIYDLSNVQHFGSANLVTNYVVNPNMEGWTNSFNGRPVVRGSVSADDFFLGGESLSERFSSATNWIVRGISGTNVFVNSNDRPQAWSGTGSLTVSSIVGLNSPVPVYWTMSGYSSVSLPASVYLVGGGSWQTNAVNHFTVWTVGTNVLMSFITTTPIED